MTGTDRSFFDDEYRRILEPFHPEAEARFETGALREMLGLAQDERILDLGCGWGRHLTLLVEAGHVAFGLDLSPDLLRQVPRIERPGDGRTPPVAAGDMRRLPFIDAAFDTVLNLATSLGLFLRDQDARNALEEARRVLRPGGRLLLEGMHGADVMAGFAPRDRWELEDGTVVRARRRLDRERGISHEVLRWGRGSRKRHSLRLRTADETFGLLEASGFEIRAAWGDWDGEPFEPNSPRLIILAARG